MAISAKRLLCVGVFGALIAPSALLFLPATAFAAPAMSDCDSAIVDEAGILDKAIVTAAIGTMENHTGADVYVRAFKTPPTGSLESYWRAEYAGCPRMLGPDGAHPKSNVILVSMSTNPRQSAISAGPGFNRIAPIEGQIRTQDMNTHFKTGDYTGGITSTLAALDQALTSSTQPVAARGPAASHNSPGSGWAVVGEVLLAIVASALGVFVLFWAIGRSRLGVAALRLRREERRAARAAAIEGQGDAKAARQRAADAVLDNDWITNAGNEFPLKLANLPEDRAAEFQRRYTTIFDSLRTPGINYALYIDTPELDPDIDGRDAAYYGRIKRNYQGVADGYVAASRDYLRLTTEVAALQTAMSPQSRARTLATAISALTGIGNDLDRLGARFNVHAYIDRLAEVNTRISVVNANQDTTDPHTAYLATEQVGRDVAALSTLVTQAVADEDTVNNAASTLRTVVDSTRTGLTKVDHAKDEATKGLKDLARLEAALPKFVAGLTAGGRKTPSEAVEGITSMRRKIAAVLASVKLVDDRKAKEAAEAERKARAQAQAALAEQRRQAAASARRVPGRPTPARRTTPMAGHTSYCTCALCVPVVYVEPSVVVVQDNSSGWGGYSGSSSSGSCDGGSSSTSGSSDSGAWGGGDSGGGDSGGPSDFGSSSSGDW
jgi:uncharacterized membrane protein YgcG